MRFFAAGLLLSLTLSLAAAAEPKPEPKGKPNRLAGEISPYLRQHAHNPVDWYPWGPEAFARAKKEKKLVFLSIGYSSCHWCHVMEKESFSNPEVAKVLNKWFVCIKVDREERPDIDHVYMTALQALGQSGGWPLSMFLTAEGKPIVGGTYWPPDDKEIDGQKVRGFKSILAILHEWSVDKPDELTKQADRLADATTRQLAVGGRGLNLIELKRDLVAEAVDGVKERYDPVHGGFGNPARGFRGPKFPTPPYLLLLQGEAGRTKNKALADMVHNTLDHMAQGGLYDQLGGGFHRYSTERTWTVPHFEKMLYDNAQLAEVYAEAFRTTRRPIYRRVLRETLDFVARELTSPEGAFCSALDADSEGHEGRFYVWTTREINAVLTLEKDANLFKQVYGADGAPNLESKYHILTLPKTLAEVAKSKRLTEAQLEEQLAPLRKKMFDARSKRPRPFLDMKVLTAWNGQMIAGYAAAGRVLEEPKYVRAAAKAADFVLKNLRTKDGRLRRTWGAAPGGRPEARLNGYLDDYAYLVHGLLNLHDATGDKKWLAEAKALTDVMVKYHGDPKGGGFFYTSNDHEKLFARAKDQYDGAQPSGNSMAARNLVRLWQKTGEEQYRGLAVKSFKAFAAPLKESPTGLTAMADALALYLDAQKKQ